MLPKDISQATFKKNETFSKAFENADTVLVQFMTSPSLNQLYGQPSTTLAGLYFMTRAMGQTDISYEDVERAFIEHQKHQKGVSSIESNDQFGDWFNRLCDYKIQRLERNIH